MKTILIRPVITEKANKLTERTDGNDRLKKGAQYTFLAALDANKIEIKNAIQERYGVEVDTLRTMVTYPKRRTRFTKAGVIEGRSARKKKVYVTLKKGDTIDFYEGI